MPGAVSIEAAFEFIGGATQPLALWTDDAEVIYYVAGLGWNLPSVPSGFAAIAESATGMRAAQS